MKIGLNFVTFSVVFNLFHCSVDQSVQTKASHYILLFNVALTVPAMLTACFLGVWSDKRGRKGPLVVASIGSSVASLVILIAIHWKLHIYVFMIGTYVEIYVTVRASKCNLDVGCKLLAASSRMFCCTILKCI